MSTALAARYERLLAEPSKRAEPTPAAPATAPAEPPVDLVAELVAMTGEPADALRDALGDRAPSLAVAAALVCVALVAVGNDDPALGRALYAALLPEWQLRAARIAERLRGARLGDAPATTAAAAPARAILGPVYAETDVNLYPLQMYSLTPQMTASQQAAALERIATAQTELDRTEAKLVEELQQPTPAVDAPTGAPREISSLVARAVFALVDPTSVFDLGRVSAVFARVLRTAPTGLAWTAYVHAYPDIAAELGWPLVAYLQTPTERAALAALDTRREAQRLIDARSADGEALLALRQVVALCNEALQSAAQGDPDLVRMIGSLSLGSNLWKRVQFNRRCAALRTATDALVANSRQGLWLLYKSGAGLASSTFDLYGPATSAALWAGSYYYTDHDSRSTRERSTTTVAETGTRLTQPQLLSLTPGVKDPQDVAKRPLLAPAAAAYDMQRQLDIQRSDVLSFNQAIGSATLAFDYYIELAPPGSALHGIESLSRMRVIGASHVIGVTEFRGVKPELNRGQPTAVKEALIAADSVIIGNLVRRANNIRDANTDSEIRFGVYPLDMRNRNAAGVPDPTDEHNREAIAFVRNWLINPPTVAADTSLDGWRVGAVFAARGAPVNDSQVVLSWHLCRYLASSVAYTATVTVVPVVVPELAGLRRPRQVPLPLEHVLAYADTVFELPALVAALADVLDPPQVERQRIASLAKQARELLGRTSAVLGIDRAATPLPQNDAPLTELAPV